MTTLQIGSKVWVLLNSGRVVSEIIAKRGNITHERPHMPVAGGLVGGGNHFVLQHTPRWAEARRVSQPLLNGAALNTYETLQDLESVHLLAAYLYKPHQWHSRHYRYCVSVIHRVILGEGLLKSSPELDDLQRVTTEFLRSVNASVVDFFPELAKLPIFLQPWRSQYLKWACRIAKYLRSGGQRSRKPLQKAQHLLHCSRRVVARRNEVYRD